MDGRFVFAMYGWSMSLDIIRFLPYFLVDSGSVHNVQFYFLFLWWKVTRSNGHLMVNLWLNLDFCYVSGIKRGSLELLGGFFQAQQFGFDFRSHIWYKCISCCFHEIYVISLSTGIWKEERKQDYRKLWKKADLLTGGFLWFLSMIKCPLNSKVELCQLDSNALR